MGIISPFSKSIGKDLNTITGATQSAKRAQQYALEQMRVNHEYQKEFAQNAHQWEMQDMQKAGLNPILSADGTGASASGGGTATGASNQANIGITDIMNSAAGLAKTKNDIDIGGTQQTLNTSQAMKNMKETDWIDDRTKAEIENMTTASAKNTADTALNKSKEELIKSQIGLNNAKAASEQTSVGNMIKNTWDGITNWWNSPEKKREYRNPTKKEREQGHLF